MADQKTVAVVLVMLFVHSIPTAAFSKLQASIGADELHRQTTTASETYVIGGGYRTASGGSAERSCGAVGLQDITTFEECRSAAEQVGIANITMVGPGRWHNVPYGCTVQQSTATPESRAVGTNGRVHFSTMHGDNNGGIGGYVLMCKQVAPENSSAMRVLLYVTTAGSRQHKSFMKCQADLLRRSPKLANADVLVYIGETSSKSSNTTQMDMQELLDKWPMPNKQLIYESHNPGRQSGAMKALHVAFSKGWFRGYDWVIRINPDVIFYDETRLFNLMENPQVRGVFQNCLCPRHGRGAHLTHTDFFAVRPEYVDEQAFADWKWRAKHGHWAEEQATAAFQHIYDSGHWANLKAPPVYHPYCRLQDGGVWHSQSTCENSLRKLGWEARFNHPDVLKREIRVAMDDEVDEEYDAPQELRAGNCQRSWPLPGISNPSNQT